MSNLHPIVIAPSLLAADYRSLAAEVRSVSSAPWLHLDVMDGHFVPPISFGAEIVAAVVRDVPQMFPDVHLMVGNPRAHVDTFIKAGAKNITFHIEACHDIAAATALVATIKQHGIGVGISVKPATSVTAIETLLPLVDLVLIMTVEPGYGGQPFLEGMVEKIATASRLRASQGYRFRLQVDGGIHERSIGTCAAAGADTFVAGSSVFKTADRAAAIAILQQRASAGRGN